MPHQRYGAGIYVNMVRNLIRVGAGSGGRRLLPQRAALWLAAICVCAGLLVFPVVAVQAAPKDATPEKPATGGVASAPGVAPAAAAPAPQPAADRPVEVRELWTGSLYSSTYRVGVCFSAQGKIRGVVYLRLYNGKVDVYHIDGTVHDNEVEAHHSSGHSFKGRLVSPDTVEGVISLKNGMNIQLKGEREHDAALAATDCAPLDK